VVSRYSLMFIRVSPTSVVENVIKCHPLLNVWAEGGDISLVLRLSVTCVISWVSGRW
jgi:hypothetical protein